MHSAANLLGQKYLKLPDTESFELINVFYTIMRPSEGMFHHVV